MKRCLTRLQRTVLYLVPVRAHHGGGHPIDLTRMDCGMPWADWNDQVVMLHPLRWWIAVYQPEG